MMIPPTDRRPLAGLVQGFFNRMFNALRRSQPIYSELSAFSTHPTNDMRSVSRDEPLLKVISTSHDIGHLISICADTNLTFETRKAAYEKLLNVIPMSNDMDQLISVGASKKYFSNEMSSAVNARLNKSLPQLQKIISKSDAIDQLIWVSKNTNLTVDIQTAAIHRLAIVLRNTNFPQLTLNNLPQLKSIQAIEGLPEDIQTAVSNRLVEVTIPDPKDLEDCSHAQFERFINDGADPNQVDQNNQSILYRAIMFDRLDLVQDLIKKGADINQASITYTSDEIGVYEIDNLDQIPLFLAVKQASIEILIALIEAGAQLDRRDFIGYTLAHWAIQNNKPKHLAALIQAKPSLRNRVVDDRFDYLDSPYELACNLNRIQCMHLLETAGADTSLRHRI